MSSFEANTWRWQPSQENLVGRSYTEAGLDLSGYSDSYVPDDGNYPLGMKKVQYQPRVSNWAVRVKIELAQGDGVTSINPGDAIFVLNDHRPRSTLEKQVLGLNPEGVNYLLDIYGDEHRPNQQFQFFKQEECERWKFAGFVQNELGTPHSRMLDNITRQRVFNLMVHHGGLDDVRARNVWRNLPNVKTGTKLSFILKKVILFGPVYHPDTKQQVRNADRGPRVRFQLVPFADHDFRFPPLAVRSFYYKRTDEDEIDNEIGIVYPVGTLFRMNGSHFVKDYSSITSRMLSQLKQCPFTSFGTFDEKIPDNDGGSLLTLVL